MGLSYKNETDITPLTADSITEKAKVVVLETNVKLLDVILKSVASQVWTNQPAAITEILGTAENRSQVDLTGFTSYRLMVDLLVVNADETTAKLGVQYSLDAGANWFGLDNGTADTISTLCADINTAAGLITHAKANITAVAKVDVLLRVVGLVSGGGGDGDPDFAKVEIQFY